MLLAQSIYACRDIREISQEKVVAYARALQHWVEEINPPAGGGPHSLAESMKELREEVKWYLSFSCYVRQGSLVLKIVIYFFKCLGFCMHFISLYVALSLHNCSSSGLLVFNHLGGISLDHTLNNNSTDSYIIYRGIYSS